jgi:hypothetical protein
MTFRDSRDLVFRELGPQKVVQIDLAFIAQVPAVRCWSRQVATLHLTYLGP